MMKRIIRPGKQTRRIRRYAIALMLARFMPEEKQNFATMATPAGDEVYYIAFNSKHAQGAAAAASFRKAFTTMLNDGRYAEIMKGFPGNEEALKRYMGDLKVRSVK